MKTTKPICWLGPLTLLTLLLAAPEVHARLPRPILVTGTVVAIAYDTQTLVLKTAKNKKPFLLDWDDHTEFLKNGQKALASALPQNQAVTVSTKTCPSAIRC